MPQRRNATFSFTETQLKWIDTQSERTGLMKAEIVRRAVDEYSEREDAKAEKSLLTPKQQQNIREIARNTGRSEEDIIRLAVDRECNRFSRRNF